MAWQLFFKCQTAWLWMQNEMIWSRLSTHYLWAWGFVKGPQFKILNACLNDWHWTHWHQPAVWSYWVLHICFMIPMFLVGRWTRPIQPVRLPPKPSPRAVEFPWSSIFRLEELEMHPALRYQVQMQTTSAWLHSIRSSRCWFLESFWLSIQFYAHMLSSLEKQAVNSFELASFPVSMGVARQCDYDCTCYADWFGA